MTTNLYSRLPRLVPRSHPLRQCMDLIAPNDCTTRVCDVADFDTSMAIRAIEDAILGVDVEDGGPVLRAIWAGAPDAEVVRIATDLAWSVVAADSDPDEVLYQVEIGLYTAHLIPEE